MAVLLEAEGRERECRSCDRGSPGPQTELASQQIGAREGERVGELEEHVVAEHGPERARAEEPGGGIADQRIGERQGVVKRPELVRLEEVERLMSEGVAVPGHLPRLGERVAEVLGDVVPEVKHERPVHDHGQQARAEHEREQLTGGDVALGRAHPRDACSPAGRRTRPARRTVANLWCR